MRILLVSHDFLPSHPSGTEIYTWQIARAFQERGHDVHIFTTEKDVGRPNLRVDLREFDGIPVHELVNNLFYNRFEETWNYPPVDRSFGIFLDDLKPDLVHFMHLMYLSVGCVEEVTKRGVPVIFTLHDYWLQCPRFGQRVHADTSVCHEIDFQRCGECLSNFKFRQSRVERASSKLLAALPGQAGSVLAPAARKLADLVRGHASPQPGPQDSESAESHHERSIKLAEQIAERDSELRRRLLPKVYRFLAPSQFLRDSYLEWGIPKEQITFSRAGIDLAPFDDFKREPSSKVRIGFIGTLAPHKGLHVLLDAWGSLSGDVKACGELLLYGPKAHNPAYLRQLEASASRNEVSLLGGLENSEVVNALKGIDLLVVPSVWYENSPLIILEALATRTPMAVTNLGGMAELVEPGVSGFRFEMGDAQDLARILHSVLTNPDELSGLYPSATTVKGVRIDAAELESLYVEALAAAGDR